jgi:hypothetical protein
MSEQYFDTDEEAERIMTIFKKAINNPWFGLTPSDPSYQEFEFIELVLKTVSADTFCELASRLLSFVHANDNVSYTEHVHRIIERNTRKEHIHIVERMFQNVKIAKSMQ